MAGASLNRGESAQDVETPFELVVAAGWKFERPVIDLAATNINAKCRLWITPEEDSLSVDWTKRLAGTVGWLNPPFDPVEPWVAKCAEEYQKGAKILLLCRGSIDSNWWWSYIQPNAVVYALTPRVQFVGQAQGYPSPLVLATFNVLGTPGGPIQRWRWR